jgi:hypothetical protein
LTILTNGLSLILILIFIMSTSLEYR